MNDAARAGRNGLATKAAGRDGTPAAGLVGTLLGTVVAGSLSKGLEVRLDAGADVEQLAVGRYVTVRGGAHTFFGMVTDVELRATASAVEHAPPPLDDDFLREVLQGTTAYAVLKVTPMLRLGAEADATPEPVKTVPPHFAPVRDATAAEVGRVFGADDSGHFTIGTPLDMDVDLCISYDRFVERSNGVFGKSGTGKTFLTRSILAHLLDKSAAQTDPKKKSVQLIFDMHNEYGWQGSSEGPGGAVKGLKQLGSIQNHVVVMTLDEASSRRRRVPYDAAVSLRYGDIEPGDLAVLKETLYLSDLAVEAAYTLARRHGARQWLARTLEATRDEEGEGQATGIHEATLENLRRGLGRLVRDKEFLRAGERPKEEKDSVESILRHLADGRSVVLEFGRYGNDLAAYMLVANVLTRRIHGAYRERVERAIGGGEGANHLIITIEEAHKFLAPSVARQTIFGEIAREMRKYQVTLLVIDQRPSMIDDEVLSQLATKVTCLLDNEKDIDAVLGGASGARDLKAVLAKLDTRRQALILGHAVPMPVVVKTEEYGSEASYAKFKAKLGGMTADDLYG